MGDAERDELADRWEPAVVGDRRRQRLKVCLEAARVTSPCPESSRASPPRLAPRPSETALGLSARERQVARRFADGRSAQEIARDLQISPWTTQDHLKAVYAKTGVNCRGDLSARVIGR